MSASAMPPLAHAEHCTTITPKHRADRSCLELTTTVAIRLSTLSPLTTRFLLSPPPLKTPSCPDYQHGKKHGKMTQKRVIGYRPASLSSVAERPSKVPQAKCDRPAASEPAEPHSVAPKR